MRVLDLGCGTGGVSLLAAAMVGPSGAVVGIDQSADAIAMATECSRESGFQQSAFCVSSVEAFSSPEPFDIVIGRYVLMYQPSPAAFIRAASRHVRLGGVVAFHEISGESNRKHSPAVHGPECPDPASSRRLSFGHSPPAKESAAALSEPCSHARMARKLGLLEREVVTKLMARDGTISGNRCRERSIRSSSCSWPFPGG
jgi:SAM-dependent methyltransferase